MAFLGQEGQRGSFGQTIGQALGTGLSSGLSNLAQFKLQQLLQQQQAGKIGSGLESLGFSPQESQSLAYLPDIVLKEITKQRLAAPQQAAYAEALQQLLGGQAPQEQMGLESLAQLGQKQSIGSSFNIPQVGLSEKQATDLAKLGLKKQELERKLSAREQEQINKETKPFYDTVAKEAKAAKDNDIRLDRMQELLNRGNLTSPYLVSAIKTVSEGIVGPHGPKIDLDFLMSADSQEFSKLSNDFLKNIKDIVGTGNLTNKEVEIYLKSIPSLLQSDSGKQRVINNLKTLNEGAKLRKKITDDVIKENGGKRPRNLDSLVDERMEPYQKEIAERFKSGIGTEESKKIESEDLAKEAKIRRAGVFGPILNLIPGL